MTEPKFQVPPPPPYAPSIPQPRTPLSSGSKQDTPQNLTKSTPKKNFASDLGLPDSVLQTKVMGGILAGVLVLGMIFGGIFFGGSSSAPAKNTGLQGVVPNPDIKAPLRRCGMADQTAACILYIVNHTRYDRLAESFFDDAVKLMERQKYLISIENSQYAKTKIPPGYLVELKIPPLR